MLENRKNLDLHWILATFLNLFIILCDKVVNFLLHHKCHFFQSVLEKRMTTCFSHNLPLFVTLWKNKTITKQFFKYLLKIAILINNLVLCDKYLLGHFWIENLQNWPCHVAHAANLFQSRVVNAILRKLPLNDLLLDSAVVFRFSRFIIIYAFCKRVEATNDRSVGILIHHNALILIKVKLCSYFDH